MVGDVTKHTSYPDRHVGPSESDITRMLDVVGASSLAELVEETIPSSIRDVIKLEEPIAEERVLGALKEIADLNEVFVSMIGMGYYDTFTPPVVMRNVIENPAWYTSYTPYQPEISQGRLELLLGFQTAICDLTGMDVANASLLDEATAAAEAMAMCRRAANKEEFVVDARCHPQTISVIRGRGAPLGIRVRVEDAATTDLSNACGVLVQYPDTTGEISDWRELAVRSHEAGALVVAAADPMALALIKPPGEWGADIVVGSTQRFGMPMGFGGPHAAFLATTEARVRIMPGRLVGISRDSAGRPAYRLALQTREQHIRREKATSNICTAQALPAMIATLFLCWHGAEGLGEIATRIHRFASRLAGAKGIRVANQSWFDTLTLRVNNAEDVIARAASKRINLRPVSETEVGVSFDETTDETVFQTLLGILGVEEGEVKVGIDDCQLRETPVLEHQMFKQFRTEHEMLRYLRRLADRDLGLDRTSIPLGSCTMKLNPTSAMIPITWEKFARIHPFAPSDQTRGYGRLISDLESALIEITGYDSVSLQPNAGSQGEFAGLMAVAAYHRERGEGQRTVCLIPTSAHGTNAASATMAGFSPVPVGCDPAGNIDLDDLREKVSQYSDHLGVMMITYPSTHGVFEESITEICELIHQNGGEVYVDGANLNAMVGLARPGRFGGDVSHLNLHKTFAIPHGGGGPGVGPVGVRSHLAPYLPSHPLDPGPSKGVPVSAAPWGSAGVLPITWVYLRMMGGDGLRRASEIAILNANYVAARLEPMFPILYKGKQGRVAHECIVDLHEVTSRSGVTAEDVAKRLADYEFHAPTLAFPVPGTLMVEPTESESLLELDRFCDAMLAIAHEIDRVESGEWPKDDNPLRNAPHTAPDLMCDDWNHPYSRQVASAIAARTYFPPVGRVDGAFGDRNLVCRCIP